MEWLVEGHQAVIDGLTEKRNLREKIIMNRATVFGLTVLALAVSNLAAAAPAVGHHGQMIIHCEPPHFFDETPGKDANVPSLSTFSVTASENTDPETIKLWLNNQPVQAKVTQERSGNYLAVGAIPANMKGRVWLKATADSQEGCDDYSSWFVQIGK
jgi:hypothetical protein